MKQKIYKLIQFSTILMLMQLPLIAIAQCDITNGLVHEYLFDGSLLDNVGSNNVTGVISSTTMQYTNNQAGIANSALQIIAGSGAQLSLANPVACADSITVCFWFKAVFPPNNFVARGVASDSLGNGIGYFGDSWVGGNIAPSFGANFTLTGDNFSAANSLPVGVWTHVAIVKVNGNTLIYYNGVPTLAVVNNANANSIIQYLFGQNNTFNMSPIGTVDNYRIYNRALDGTELVQLYNAAPLLITQQPQSEFLCSNSNGNVTLTVTHTQTAFSYQWYKNGNAIANSNNDSLIITSASFADSGNYIVRIISNCNDTVISTSAIIAIGFATPPAVTNLNYFQSFNGSGGSAFTNIGSPTTNTANTHYDIHGGGAVTISNLNGGFNVSPSWSDTISSLSFWYKPFIASNNGNPFYLWGVPALGTSTVAGFTPCAIGSNLQLGYVSTGSAFTSGGVSLTFNQWHLITVNVIGKKYTVYLNGNLAYTVTLPYNTIDAPLAYIGNTGAGTANPSKGALGVFNDLFINADTLNSQAISGIYQQIKFTTFNPQACDSALGYRLSVNGSSASLPLYYKWYKNNVALINNTHTSGVESNTLLFDRFVYAADTGVYKCEITNGCAIATYTNNIQVSLGGTWQYNAPYISITPNTNACTGSVTQIAFDTIAQAPALVTTHQIKYNGTFIPITNPLIIAPNAYGTYEFIANSAAVGCEGITTFNYSGNVINKIFKEVSSNNCGSGTFGNAIEEVNTFDCDSSITDSNFHYYKDINGKGIVASVNTFGQTNPITSVVMYNESPTVTVILDNNNLTDFNAYYMHKTWAVNTNNNISLSALVNIRLYYTQADLDAMKLAINCPTCTDADLVLSKHDLGNSVHDCNADNSNYNINASIYWQKDSANTANEYGVISNFAGNNAPIANGNLPLGVVGGSAHGNEFDGKYFEATVEGFSEFRLHLIPLPNVTQIACVNNIYPVNNAINIHLNSDSLVWTRNPNATSYDINIKENGNTIILANTTDTMLSLAQFMSANGLIQFNKTYTWTVIPTDGFNYATACTSSIFSTTIPPTFCIPTLTLPFNNINFSGFKIKGEQNTLHALTTNINSFYVDSSSSNQIPILEMGKSYYFTTSTNGNQNKELYMYIDGNNDGVFSTTELLVDSLVYDFTQACNVNIPNNANFTNGFRRVRIIVQQQSGQQNIHPHPNASNACTLAESVVYDFTCELKSFATPYILSTLKPTASNVLYQCDNDVVTTIGVGSNSGSFVSFVDSNNHIFARVYPLANTTLGNVQAFYRKTLDDTIRTGGGKYIASREITVYTEVQPTSAYRFRYYLPANELDSIIANTNGAVTTVNNLQVMKDPSYCGNYYDPITQTTTFGVALPMPTANFYTPNNFTTLPSGDYAIDVNGLTSFSTFYLTAPINNGPLSVNEITLDAFSNIDEDVLQYQIQNKKLFELLELQHSNDGISYKTIKTENGKEKNSFNFTNTKINSGTNYYRVKGIEANGKEIFSATKTTIHNENNTIIIYPNPATKEATLQINVTKNSNGVIKIFNTTGALVYAINASLEKGTNAIALPIHSLASGLYQVRVSIDAYQHVNTILNIQ
jgi:Concanavalin A-like lectin/glucanases superfamily/Secretion system C-terminal sorting domain/GEVED domain